MCLYFVVGNGLLLLLFVSLFCKQLFVYMAKFMLDYCIQCACVCVSRDGNLGVTSSVQMSSLSLLPLRKCKKVDECELYAE